MKKIIALLAIVTFGFAPYFAASQGAFEEMVKKLEWPNTDFSKHTVPLDEIVHGGPPKDGIPAIQDPEFLPAHLIRNIGEDEPVISVEIDGKVRAYPFRILMYHEIVNDEIKGQPIAVTFCPLCNSAVVFSRMVEGEPTRFGVSGWLRNSDMVMYDWATDSWWQQFTGEAIVGERAGMELKKIPARIESFSRFKKRHPRGGVLVPTEQGQRNYGTNPYVDYDSTDRPFFPVSSMPANIPPMARVVTVDDRAWALTLVRKEKRVETEDGLVITWEKGQNSALDTNEIREGRDIGNVLVQKKTENGLKDVPYSVDFAFAFHAFYPDQPIQTE